MSGEDYLVVVVVYLKRMYLIISQAIYLFIYKALKIACNGSDIEQVTSQNLLVETLDNHLNCTKHIDDLCKKVAQRIAVLKKNKRNLCLAERTLFFNALIKPIMLYGSCAWTTATEQNVKRVFNPFAPEPPVTARADPRPFYPL